MADKEKKEYKLPTGKDVTTLTEAINKAMGGEVCRTGGNVGEVVDISYLYPTGILSLDKYLGIGGTLGGRVINIYGWEGTGKTLTTLTIAAFIQRQKFTPCASNPVGEGRVAFLDAEGSFSPSMAKSVGVDTSKLILIQSTPEMILTGEHYFDMMKILVQNGIEMIIVDSLPALVPSSRMNATIGHGQKATSAVLIAEGLQQLTPLLNGFKRSTIWMINQIRMRPMVMFGPTEGHTGGEALKFYESYAIEVKKRGDIVKQVPGMSGQFEDKRIGVTVEAKLHKNKTASIPCDPVQYDIYFETTTDKDGLMYYTGVDVYKDTVQVAIQTGVIQKSSSWYSYGDIKGNGVDNLITILRGMDKLVLDEIRQKVLSGRK